MIRALALVLLFASQALALPADVVQITIQEASRAGLDPAFLLAVVDIESGGNCSAQTGSYKGLLQLSDAQMKGGDPFDCRANLHAGAKMLAGEADTFRLANGRDPTAAELYLIHQQGAEGQAAHANNLDLPAWKSLWLWTSEGVSRGQFWSRQAIWGNVPADTRNQYGSVENVTSRTFISIWAGRLEDRMRKLAPPPPTEAYRCFIPAHGLDRLRRE